MIRALVTGAGGQVGAELAREFEGRAELVLHDRASLDLARPADIVQRVREVRPQLILNAAAYTAVDRAESQPGEARAINAVAPGVFAEEARRCGALLVHYSTDYVFDGSKASPYVEDDAPAPLGVYGATKLEGERAIAASGCAYLVLRTSWVYAPRGKNFLLTMLRLAAEGKPIRVVDDQRGAPTWSREIARATLALLLRAAPARPITAGDIGGAAACAGLYHATASGATTWFGFAQAIFERCSRRRGASFAAPPLVPITTQEYPLPARRPANSLLSCEKLARTFGVRMAPWRDALEQALAQLP